MQLYPQQYLECDPPVAAKIEERTIQQHTRKDLMPTRNTNRHLNRNKRGAAGTSGPSANVSTADAVSMKCLDYLLGSGTKASPPKFGNSAVVEPLALTDAPMHGAVPPAAAAAAPAAFVGVPATRVGTPLGGGGVGSIIAQAKAALGGNKGKKGAAAAIKGATAMKKNPQRNPAPTRTTRMKRMKGKKRKTRRATKKKMRMTTMTRMRWR